MTRYSVNNTQAEAKIVAEEIFHTSWVTLPDVGRVLRFSGAAGGAQSLGLLPEEHHESARSARYVVSSYGTPIGWVTEHDVRVVPNVGYSITTGYHQSMVRHAWGLPPAYAERGRMIVQPEATHIQYGRERRLRAGGMDGVGNTISDLVNDSPDAMHWRP